MMHISPRRKKSTRKTGSQERDKERGGGGGKGEAGGQKTRHTDRMPLARVVLSVGISLTNVPEHSPPLEGPLQWTDGAQKGAAATPTEKQKDP